MTLTQAQAEFRSTLIQKQSITYSLHLNLYQTGYTGLSQLQFTLLSTSNELFIDCSSKKITKYIINGALVEKFRQEGSHLYVQEDKQKTGINKILVQYENTYNTDQRGLMSFVDVDAKQYLYTTLEAYFAHRVFAVFDQPDLKAIMNLSVTCPVSWMRVLSNEYPILNEHLDQEKYLVTTLTWHKEELGSYLKCGQQRRMAMFPPTLLMPTYLFCILAGPFEQIQLEKQKRYNNIPMSLYCSTSNLPYVQKMTEYLFETTVQCMRFFQRFFGVPYAFSKYDQVFVHEMQSCAMENTGMVTYHDAEYIWTNEVTQQKALDLADTMAHQLAHHWFGNLTTMKWWDDLWLNESFAQFIGYYVLEVIQNDLKVVKFQSSMAQFLIKKSQRGYFDDKSIITHPIRGTVANTAVAQAIFDGITYAKGAATLKQLVLLMGDQNFSAALKQYFTKYAFKNTTLDDFINCLQNHFNNQHDLTLHEWKKLWLEQPSLNQLEPIWWKSKLQSGQQQQKILTIVQRPYTEQYPTLRPHKIKIALFKEDCSYDVIEVFIPANSQISIPFDPETAKSYHAVLLNYEDHAFAKVIIDKHSQQFFIKNILKIKDTLTRTYIWRNFYDMVVDAVIPATKYIDLFTANIGEQSSDTIVQRNYQCAINCIELYTPQAYRDELSIRVFYFTLGLLEKTGVDRKNRVVSLQDNLCKLASSELAIRCIYRWYQGKYPSLAHHEPSNLNKWEIIAKVFTLSNISREQKLQILEKRLKEDESEVANLNKLRCQAMICSQQQFETKYKSLLDPQSGLTVNTKKYLMQGLNSSPNNNSLCKYKQRYFDDIQQIAKVMQPEHVKHFMYGMRQSDDNLEQWIKKLKAVKMEDQHMFKAKYKMLKLIDFSEKRFKCQQRFLQDL